MLWMIRVRRLFKAVGREALMLLYALRNPATPAPIKLATLLLGVYLVSPLDRQLALKAKDVRECRRVQAGTDPVGPLVACWADRGNFSQRLSLDGGRDGLHGDRPHRLVGQRPGGRRC